MGYCSSPKKFSAQCVYFVYPYLRGDDITASRCYSFVFLTFCWT